MGLTLSVTEVLPIVADFATVLGFACFIFTRLFAILPASINPLLNNNQAVVLGPQLYFFASGHRVQRGFWHGRTCIEQSDSLWHEFHRQQEALCGGLLLLQPDIPLFGTAHTADVAEHNCPGCASKLVHTCGVQQDLCHTSRSVGLPSFRVPHKTFRELALGIRGRNMVAWVYLARLSSFLKNSRSL